MSYGKLLQKIIADANLTYKEVAEKCTANGKKIDPSYISKLVNGKIISPSDQITKMIAEVCGVNPNKLIIEGYVDKAPNEIKKFIDDIRISTQFSHLDSIENNRDIYERSLENQSIAEFILDFNAANFTNNNSVIGGIPFEDDSMEPLIPKGSKLIISKFKDNPQNIINIGGKGLGYDDIYINAAKIFHNDEIGFLYAKDGDIIVAWDLDENKLLVRIFRRSVLPEDDVLNYYLFPINGKFKVKVGQYDETYFNLARIENQKTVLNKDLIDVLNREFKVEYNDQIITFKKDSLGLCILGKVQSIITDLDI